MSIQVYYKMYLIFIMACRPMKSPLALEAVTIGLIRTSERVKGHRVYTLSALGTL